MANGYLVLSDLHLCDVEEHADGWKSYKSERFTFDAELSALLTRFEASAQPGDGLTLVLNGDIVDFDLVTAEPDPAPWPVAGHERRRGLEPTEAKSAWKLQRVLSHHHALVEALAAFIVRGHRVVYVLGNHDRELHFEGVQSVLVDALRDAGTRLCLVVPERPVRFEPWFFHVPGELYAEHGNQYDYYTSFRHLLEPTWTHGGARHIALPMGNLSNRYLMSSMGYFNPHAADYILNVFSYLTHWLRHYAFTRRSLALNWFFGSLAAMGALLRQRGRTLRLPDDYDGRLAQAAQRADLSVEQILKLRALARKPITDRFFRVAREFWIDRLALALLMTLGTVMLAVADVPLWVKWMVPFSSFPLLYLGYEWLARGETIFTVEHEIPLIARAIGELLKVPIVTFGHTHLPRTIPVSKGVTFVDTGTWAPMLKERNRHAPGYWNYLQARVENGEATLLLGSWLSAERCQPAHSRKG